MLAERIVVQQLIDFRYYSILEGTGLWREISKAAFPFAVPVAAESPPQGGYLPAEDMSQLLEGAATMTVPENPYSRAARVDILEVVESLAEDHLDLFSVLK